MKGSSFLESRTMLVIGAACTLMVLAALAAVLLVERTPRGPAGPTAAEQLLYRDYNFAILRPPGWNMHDELKRAIRANALAMAKDDSPARFALAFSNFRTRQPQPGELRDGLVADRLERIFQDLDVEQSTSQWLGQPALRIQFRGRQGENTFAGEGYAVGVHGIAYWFLGWTLQADYAALAPELEAIRNGCRLIDPDQAWSPSTAGIRTFRGRGANYVLTDGDQWWEEQSEPTTEDPKADMLLKARFRVRQRTDFPPVAWAAVYLLPGADDAAAAGVGYVQARYRALGLANFDALTGPAFGDPPAAGMAGNTEAIRRFHAHGDDPNGAKLVVVHAVRIGEQIVCIEAWCPWSDRNRWEMRLIALAASLKL